MDRAQRAPEPEDEKNDNVNERAIRLYKTTKRKQYVNERGGQAHSKRYEVF